MMRGGAGARGFRPRRVASAGGGATGDLAAGWSKNDAGASGSSSSAGLRTAGACAAAGGGCGGGLPARSPCQLATSPDGDSAPGGIGLAVGVPSPALEATRLDTDASSSETVGTCVTRWAPPGSLLPPGVRARAFVPGLKRLCGPRRPMACCAT